MNLFSFKVWITAEKQDLTAGIYFWPGSETEFDGLRPRYYFNYNGLAIHTHSEVSDHLENGR